MTLAITNELNMSDSASDQLANLVNNENNDDIKGIRIFVSGSGCSGVQYGMTFADSVADTDGVLEYENISIYVDQQCLATMNGIEVDFADGPNGPSFIFNNTRPAETGCNTCPSAGGCG